MRCREYPPPPISPRAALSLRRLLYAAVACASVPCPPPPPAPRSTNMQELVCFVRMRADYHTGVGSRSQWARELFPHEGDGVSFGAFGGGG